jgi:hypothetical protein
MEVSGQLHAPAALYPEKETRYPLDRRLDGPQSRSGRDGEEKNSQPLRGLETQIVQPIAQRYTTGSYNYHCIIYLNMSTGESSLGL